VAPLEHIFRWGSGYS